MDRPAVGDLRLAVQARERRLVVVDMVLRLAVRRLAATDLPEVDLRLAVPVVGARHPERLAVPVHLPATVHLERLPATVRLVVVRLLVCPAVRRLAVPVPVRLLVTVLPAVRRLAVPVPERPLVMVLPAVPRQAVPVPVRLLVTVRLAVEHLVAALVERLPATVRLPARLVVATVARLVVRLPVGAALLPVVRPAATAAVSRRLRLVRPARVRGRRWRRCRLPGMP